VRVAAPFLLALAPSLAGACNKGLVTTEEDAQVMDLPPLTTQEPAPAPPPPLASVMAPASASATRADAGAEAGAEAGARADAGSGSRMDAGDGGDGGGGCGDAGLRDCPLQGWMKANCSPPVVSGDLDALAAAFDRIATFAPPPTADFVNWVSISTDGADAARAASMVGVKGACRGCHQQYKDRYRSRDRARPLP